MFLSHNFLFQILPGLALQSSQFFNKVKSLVIPVLCTICLYADTYYSIPLTDGIVWVKMADRNATWKITAEPTVWNTLLLGTFEQLTFAPPRIPLGLGAASTCWFLLPLVAWTIVAISTTGIQTRDLHDDRLGRCQGGFSSGITSVAGFPPIPQ